MEAGLRRRRTSASSSTLSTTKLPTTPAASQNESNSALFPTSPASSNGPGYDEDKPTIAAAFRKKGDATSDLVAFVMREVRNRGIETRSVETADESHLVLLLNMPFQQMLETAETLALRKRDLDGHVRAFEAADIDSFALKREPDALFTHSEQLLMLQYCVDQIKPDKKKFDDVRGNEGILAWCKRQKHLTDVFPLHHAPTAQAILDELTFSTPLFDIGGISRLQDYFGDKVALYFAFLTFYTRSLFAYGIAGLSVTVAKYIFPRYIPFFLFMFSLFASLWGAYFTSSWRRRNIEIVYMWTSLILGDSSDESLMAMTKKEDLRDEFYGKEVNHRITGEKIVVFPKRQKYMRFAVSSVVVVIALICSCWVMLKALYVEDVVHTWLDENAMKHRWSSPYIMRELVLKNMPLVLYLVALNVLDTVYFKIAMFFTEKENHKYHSDYENSLVLKLVLFQFLNMNMAYLFVAFVRKDYERLASSMRSVLLMELVIGNIKETVIPIFLSKWRSRKKVAAAAEKKKEAAAAAAGVDRDLQTSSDLSGKEPEIIVDPITSQLEMDSYEGVFDDYFELVRQFSQITLFAAAFPLGAALAALNNCIEVKADTYKLVHMTRRSAPRRALNIGAWIRAFEFISVSSIMTNLGIITVTASYAKAVVGTFAEDEYFVFFIVIVVEHLIFVLRALFTTIISNTPTWVRDSRAKERFLASRKRGRYASDTNKASANKEE